MGNRIFKVTVYRDDSETSVVYENVRHAFMTCGNTVLTIAQYSESEGTIKHEGETEARPIKLGPGITTKHHYINWPREKIAWWKVERS